MFSKSKRVNHLTVAKNWPCQLDSWQKLWHDFKRYKTQNWRSKYEHTYNGDKMDEEIQVPLESLQQETAAKEKKKYASETSIIRMIREVIVFPDYMSDGQCLYKKTSASEHSRKHGFGANYWSVEEQYQKLDVTAFEKEFYSVILAKKQVHPDDFWKYDNIIKKQFRDTLFSQIIEDLFNSMNAEGQYVHPASNSTETKIHAHKKLIIEPEITPYVSEQDKENMDEFLSRMTNEKAFLIRLITSFYTEANRDQYLYLQGPGGDSKSSFVAAFLDFIGAGIWTQHGSEKGAFADKFALEDFAGKRFYVLQDMEDDAFKAPLLKRLSEKKIAVTPKYKKVNPDTLNHIISIVHGNPPPDVHNEASYMRRIIWCKIEKFTGKKGNVIDSMKRAMPYLMHKAYWVWVESGKDLYDIPVDNRELEAIQTSKHDENAEDLLELLLKYRLNKDVNGFLPRQELRHVVNSFVRTSEGQSFKHFCGNDNNYGKLKKELIRCGFYEYQKNRVKGFSGLSLINREETLEHKQERESEEITAQVNFNRYEMEMETIRQQNLKPPKPIDLQAFIEEQLGKKVH